MSTHQHRIAARAWAFLSTGFLLTAAAGLLGALVAPDAASAPVLRALTAVLLTGAWIATVAFVLLDTWGRWVWLVIVVGAGILAWSAQIGGMIGGLVLSEVFLSFRRYRPWRALSDRRRALGFALGLAALVLLVLSRGFWHDPPGDAGDPSPLTTLAGWALGSLAFFWLWSLFHLAMRMRLHFLRLRLKLAVSAVLIGVVPLLLVAGLALMVLYTGLGGARATRTTNILESWRLIAAGGGELAAVPFDSTFAWSADGRGAGRVGDLPTPPWAAPLSGALAAADTAAAAAGTDSTGWFLVDGDIWLMRWRGAGTPAATARGWLLGRRPLEHLSRIIKAGIDLSPIQTSSRDGDLVLGSPSARDRAAFAGRQAAYRDLAGDPSFWGQFSYFGGTLFEVAGFDGESLSKRTIFLVLRVRWQDLKAEFLEGENNINVAVVVSLALVAFLFLVLEIFALFFGIRISEGIVSAVHALHRGTRALGGGDLETRIRIPNEDEFGDLADSFNEMTVALKKGRDDALARERLTRELETARGIQERLLPEAEPSVPGFEVTGSSVPSREVGGDYFDFLIRPDDKIGVAVGDVSGKGMPAALLMSNLQASLHGQVIHPSSVAEVVARVNDLLVESTDPHMFATFFYGLLDTRTGEFSSTNAGHNPPLLLRSDGSIETLGVGGLLLGMLPDQQYRQQSVTLAPGEVIVLYTDGITEAVGPSAEEDDPEAMFGEEALEEVLRRSRHLPAVGIKEAILDAVAAHTAGVDQSDDITLVVVRRQG